MKKFLLISILIMVIILITTGCSDGEKEKIKKSLDTNLENIQNRSYRSISELIGDSASGSLGNLKFSDKSTKLITEANKKIELVINSIKIEGDEATANITVNSDDLAKAVVDAIDSDLINRLATVSSKSAEESFNEEFVRELQKRNFSKKTGNIIFKKENNTWIIKDTKELMNIIIGEI